MVGIINRKVAARNRGQERMEKNRLQCDQSSYRGWLKRERQTDRQTDRQTETERDRERQRETEKMTCKEPPSLCTDIMSGCLRWNIVVKSHILLKKLC